MIKHREFYTTLHYKWYIEGNIRRTEAGQSFFAVDRLALPYINPLDLLLNFLEYFWLNLVFSYDVNYGFRPLSRCIFFWRKYKAYIFLNENEKKDTQRISFLVRSDLVHFLMWNVVIIASNTDEMHEKTKKRSTVRLKMVCGNKILITGCENIWGKLYGAAWN